jgi:hypothetical protein
MEKIIILNPRICYMNYPLESHAKRTMPVCLTPDQMRTIEEYAKRNGMLNASQAIEKAAGSIE